MIKRILACFLAICLCLGLMSCAQSNPAPTTTPAAEEPGSDAVAEETFTATSQGFGGDVTATITMAGGELTACVLTGDAETPAIGGNALSTLEEQVLAAGGADIDGVAGATITSNAVKAAVQDCLDQANGVEKTETLSFIPGTYEGSAFGMMGEIKVSVTVDKTSIQEINVTEFNETQLIGWGLDTAPIELLPQEMVKYQTLNVDAVTGATVTSNGLKSAVANALAASGVEISLLQNGPKPVRESSDETLSCDIVVAGAGGAGLMAALEAAYNGADVIVVEKAGVLTGSSTRNGGLLMAAGTEYADLSTEALIDFIYEDIGRKNVDEVRIRGLVEGSNDLLKFFMHQGTVIECVQNIWDGAVDLPAVYMAAAENPDCEIDLKEYTTSIGSYYIVPLYERALELGVKFLFNTPMTSLTTENGRVTGLLCERADGTSVQVSADSTILATGGFAGDPEKIAANRTMQENQYSYYGSNTNTGEGMLAAEAIGAAIRYEDDMPFLATLTSAYTGNWFLSLMVTPAGERFTKEYDYHNAVSADLNRAGWCYAYEIIDESFEGDAYAAAIAAHEDGSAGANVVAADSVQELAEKLAMDPSTLEATLTRYNELCAMGVDEDYGKDAQYLKPIAVDGSKRLFALKSTVSITDSFGGIQTDPVARVLDTDGDPISGLYAAGAVAFTDWIDVEYPGCGYGFAIALYMGRMAGVTALTDMGVPDVKDIVLLEQ